MKALEPNGLLARSLLILACLAASASAEDAADPFADAEVDADVVPWSDLVPEGWQPSYQDMGMFFHDPSAPAATQASVDTPVVDELHDKRLSLEGWLVPLEIERAERYHEFLLVPYFGACYHVPPPPPNQIVHLFLEEGVSRNELFEPQRVTGRLRVDGQVTELASAAYSMIDATSKTLEW